MGFSSPHRPVSLLLLLSLAVINGLIDPALKVEQTVLETANVADSDAVVPEGSRFAPATSSGCPFGRRVRAADPCKDADQSAPASTNLAEASSSDQTGSPGAEWSDEELLIVRTKLTRAYSADETNGLADELYPEGVPFDPDPATNEGDWKGWRDGISAEKVLRLGFHDCMKYRDGSGGCDGCINWHGMGYRYLDEDLEQGDLGVGGDDHNNGLRFTVMVLESIYTNPAFPARTPQLATSLKESGKSRADLWAFATMVAVDFAIETNNLVCTDPEHPSLWTGQNTQCNHNKDMPNCQIFKERDFIFKSGRSDCVHHEEQPYMATKIEQAPCATCNGTTTLEYFNDEFGMSPMETVTLMGAHTIGSLHVSHSQFRYTWTARNTRMFNNQYFRNIVGKRDWFYQAGDHDCNPVGDINGDPGMAQWTTKVRGDNINGGNVQWIQKKLVCPNCPYELKNGFTSKDKDGNYCCQDVPEDSPGMCVDTDGDPYRGCEQYRFISGADETALPAEMGLYKKFVVGGDGFPYGEDGSCPGLENFNRETIGGPAKADFYHQYLSWSRQDNHIADTGCPMTDLAGIYEEYADNSTKFVDNFVPVLEKMLANGVEFSGGSVEKPVPSNGVLCPLPGKGNDARFWVCYEPEKLGAPVTIENYPLYSTDKRMARTVDIGTNAITEATLEQPVPANQLWYVVPAGVGDIYINVATGVVLSYGEVGEWRSDNTWKSDRTWLYAVGGGYDEPYALAWDKSDTSDKMWFHATKDRRWKVFSWIITEVDSSNAAPTESPTQSPTFTYSPTDSPTESPTDSPTDAPTDAPTNAPTDAPTDAPTNAPTESPTESPTNDPTESPTNDPECVQSDGTRYLPLNMAGQGRTSEASWEHCQERCASTAGCEFFNSFSNGGCHISDGSDGSEIDEGNPTAKAGKATCMDGSSTPTECVRSDGTWYLPLNMAGQGRTSEASWEDCQERCASTAGCRFFNSFSGGGCHISDGSDGSKFNEGNPTAKAGRATCMD